MKLLFTFLFIYGLLKNHPLEQPVKTLCYNPHDAFLYFAMNHHCYRYDGKQVQQIQSVAFPVYTLQTYKDTLFAAGDYAIALIHLTTKQVLDQKNIEEKIIDSYRIKDRFYFVGDYAVYVYLLNQRQWKIIALPERVMGSGVVNNVLWLNLRRIGMHYIDENLAPVALPFADFFQTLPVVRIVTWRNQPLIAAYNNHFYTVKQLQIRPIPTPTLLKKEGIYDVVATASYLFVATLEGTIVQLDTQMQVIHQWKSTEKTLYALHHSTVPVLWVGHQSGFTALFYQAPVSALSLPDAPVLRMQVQQQRLFLCTTKGLYLLNQQTFQRLTPPKWICTKIFFHQNQWYLSTTKGIWYSSDLKNWKPLVKLRAVIDFFWKQDTLIVETPQKWLVLKRIQQQWKLLKISEQQLRYYIAQRTTYPTHSFLYPLPFSVVATATLLPFQFALTAKQLWRFHLKDTTKIPLPYWNGNQWIDFINPQNFSIEIVQSDSVRYWFYISSDKRIKRLLRKERVTTTAVIPPSCKHWIVAFFTLLAVAIGWYLYEKHR